MYHDMPTNGNYKMCSATIEEKNTQELAESADRAARMKRRAWAIQTILTPIVLRNKGADPALEGLLQLVDDLVDDLEDVDAECDAEFLASTESEG